MIEHSAPTVGGYFCSVRGRAPFSQRRPARARSRACARWSRPTNRSRNRSCRVSEAMQLFYDRGELDKARLLAHRRRDTLVLYALRGRRDYFQGYMVPSTGCLRGFGLEWFPAGFLLRFPHQARPLEVAHVEPYPKLFEVFEEAGEWLDKLGIRNAGSLNDAIQEGRLQEISLVAEALHEARIAKIASEIVGCRRPHPRRARRRPFLVRQDDVLEAARGAAARQRAAPVPAGARRLLRRPRAHAARRARRGRISRRCTRSTCTCSTSTCSR